MEVYCIEHNILPKPFFMSNFCITFGKRGLFKTNNPLVLRKYDKV